MTRQTVLALVAAVILIAAAAAATAAIPPTALPRPSPLRRPAIGVDNAQWIRWPTPNEERSSPKIERPRHGARSRRGRYTREVQPFDINIRTTPFNAERSTIHSAGNRQKTNREIVQLLRY